MDSLEAEQDERIVAMAHKTPKKRKMDELFPSSPSNPYKRLMDEDFAFSNENSNGYAQHFDDSLAILSNEVVKITKAQSLLGRLLVGSSESSNIRMDEITDLIGVKPPLLEGIFDAPHYTLQHLRLDRKSVVLKRVTDLQHLRLDRKSVVSVE